MNSTVKLVGPWPKDFEKELDQVVSSDVQLEYAGETALGAISLGDIGSLLGAAAAVAGVAITLWNTRKLSKSDDLPDIDELNQQTRRRGVFGVNIERLKPSPDDPGMVNIMVLDETSGNEFKFVITIGDRNTTIAIDRTETILELPTATPAKKASEE